MEACVTHFSPREGAPWEPWPFPAHMKPSNPEMLTYRDPCRVVFRISSCPPTHVAIHALKLDNGREWDSVNGYRDGENRPS